MITESEIVFELGDYYVVRKTWKRSAGYVIYRNGVTAAEQVATIAYDGDRGLAMAHAEIDRRLTREYFGPSYEPYDDRVNDESPD